MIIIDNIIALNLIEISELNKYGVRKWLTVLQKINK